MTEAEPKRLETQNTLKLVVYQSTGSYLNSIYFN